MRGGLDFAEAALGVGGKLIGSLTGVGRGLGYHPGLDVVERGVLIDGLILIVSGGDGYPLTQQFGLAWYQFIDKLDIGRGHYYDRSDIVAERLGIGIVTLGLHVYDLRRLHQYLVGFHSVAFKEAGDLGVIVGDAVIDGSQVVAYLLDHDGPGDLVGHHLFLGQTAHGYHSVAESKIVDAGFYKQTQTSETQRYEQGSDQGGGFTVHAQGLFVKGQFIKSRDIKLVFVKFVRAIELVVEIGGGGLLGGLGVDLGVKVVHVDKLRGGIAL